MHMHVLAIGQSNLSNHGEPAGSSAYGTVLASGTSHPMTDPIAGGTGAEGSIWPRVADTLAASGKLDSFTLSLRAQGGTSVTEWSPGGKCFEMLAPELDALAAIDPPITHILWQQGEKDTLEQTSTEDYKTKFKSMFEPVSAALPNAQWIICQASRRIGVMNPPVVEAQAQLAAELPNARAGFNLDTLGEEFRRDNTHLNADGLATFGAAIAANLLEDV